jgi:hypothetical protein
MSDVVYVSKVRIERKIRPLRTAYLPGESQPVTISVHGAIAQHYKVDPAKPPRKKRYGGTSRSGLLGRRSRPHLPGHDALGCLDPGHPVFGNNEPGTLLKVQHGEHYRRHRQQGKRNRPPAAFADFRSSKDNRGPALMPGHCLGLRRRIALRPRDHGSRISRS